MPSLPTEAQKFAEKVFDAFGGKKEFFEAADAELAEINTRWKQNIEAIGRILRAHLFAEHYLSVYLAHANPRLGSIDEARLTFAQKIRLLDSQNAEVAAVLPGIQRLNAIRNRLAHNLNANATEDDTKVFLNCQPFAALRIARDPSVKPSSDPLAIIEEFALHLGVALTREFSPVGKAIAKASQSIGRS